MDVGANDGGFSSAIRAIGYAGRIISFEPLTGPYEKLRRRASGDTHWETINCAVGDTAGEVTINVSENAGLSSSVLPMLDTHINAAPNSAYVAT